MTVYVQSFLPDSKESIVLTRRRRENFKFKDFELKQKKEVMYLFIMIMYYLKPALAKDLKIIESDEPEMKGNPEGMKKKILLNKILMKYEILNLSLSILTLLFSIRMVYFTLKNLQIHLAQILKVIFWVLFYFSQVFNL